MRVLPRLLLLLVVFASLKNLTLQLHPSLSLFLSFSLSLSPSIDSQAAWSSIIVTAGGISGAYIALHNTDNKLQRFSSTVVALDHVKLWWNSMGEAEKLSIETINELIRNCEELMQPERQPWVTSPYAAKMLRNREKQA